MKQNSIKLVMCVLVALLAISAADATKYIVKPSDMNGWVLATVTSATPIPGYSGRSTGFVNPAPRGLVTPRPPAALKGAFYADLGADGSTTYHPVQGQIWLGTNKYNGTSLDQITDMSYFTWTTNDGPYDQNKNQYATPKQPFCMRLIIKEADPSTKTHMLMYRPRTNGTPVGTGWPAIPDEYAYVNRWVQHNPTVNGTWAEFQRFEGPPVTCTYETGPLSFWASKYPGATITKPALQIPDMTGIVASEGRWPESDPVDTPNECGLTLQWGAEYRPITDQADQPYSPYLNWWRECWNGKGYLDYFEIGINDNYDLYDFEADVPGKLVASSTTSANASAGTMPGWTNTSLLGQASYNGHLNLEFRMIGKIIAAQVISTKDCSKNVAVPNPNEFVISDGGVTMRVFCYSHGYTVGQWVTVTGKLMPGYACFPEDKTSKIKTMRLMTTPPDIKILSL